MVSLNVSSVTPQDGVLVGEAPTYGPTYGLPRQLAVLRCQSGGVCAETPAPNPSPGSLKRWKEPGW